MSRSNIKRLYWPDSRVDDPDLRWLLDNQREIVRAWGTRKMRGKARPIIEYRTGRVRVEFVGTFDSWADAKAACQAKICEGEKR